MVKKTMQEWIDEIDDSRMHHIGEYYRYLTGKPFFKKNGYPRKPFIEWVKENYEEMNKLDLGRFCTYRSMFVGFLFCRKENL